MEQGFYLLEFLFAVLLVFIILFSPIWFPLAIAWCRRRKPFSFLWLAIFVIVESLALAAAWYLMWLMGQD
jgi:hypothetical protein